MREIQISRRLSAVAALVSPGLVLADVGCDHGYIPIYLIQKGQIPRAIAMDINQGPLLRAREHIREWGLEDYIETRLSDGVEALKPGEAQCLVIAGMGGPLMEENPYPGRKCSERHERTDPPALSQKSAISAGFWLKMVMRSSKRIWWRKTENSIL